jgi:gamma-glutamyltranspeptidase
MSFTKVKQQKTGKYLQSKGIITMQDLAQYEAKWRTALRFNYKDLNIISMPPPSSGITGTNLKNDCSFDIEKWSIIRLK